VRGVNVLRQQTAAQAAERPVPEPAGSEVGMASENRERYKSLVSVHIAVELIRPEGRRLYFEMHRLIYCVRKQGRTA